MNSNNTVWWRAAVGGALLSLAALGTLSMFPPHNAVGERVAWVAMGWAFVVGMAFWSLVLRVHQQPPLWSGLLVGLAVSALVQPLTWSVLVLFDDQPLTGSSVAWVVLFSVVGAIVSAPLGIATGAVTILLAKVRVALWSPST